MRSSTLILSLLFALIVTVNAVSAQTNTWTGVTSSDWYTASNWSLAAVPTAAHDVRINTGSAFYPDVASGSAVCRTLFVNTGGALTVSGGTVQANISVTVNTGGTLTLSSGTFNSIGSFAVNNAATFEMSSGVLNLTSNFASGATAIVQCDGGVFRFIRSTGVQSINGTNLELFNLEIANTSVAPNNRVNVLKEIFVKGDVTLTAGNLAPGVGTASNAINVGGNWIYNGGGFIPNFGQVTFYGNTDASISGAGAGTTTFYDLVVSKSSGAQALTLQRPAVVSNSVEIQQGELVVMPQTGTELAIAQDLRIISTGAIFLGNTAGTANVEVAIGRNLIDYNVVAPNRNVATNTAVGLNFTDRFAKIIFNSANAGVTQTIRGYGPVTAVNPGNNLSQGLRLPSVDVVTASAIYIENDGCRIAGNVNLTQGTFSLNGRTLIFGTGLASPNAGQFTVGGTGVLDCNGGSNLLFSSVDVPGPLLTTDGVGGYIRFIGSGAGSNVRLMRDALSGQYYRVVIANGGRLGARFYNISLIHQSGLIMQTGSLLDAAPNNLSDGTFNETNAGAAIIYMSLNQDIAGGTTISNVVFNYSATVQNCFRPAAAVGEVTFLNCTGVRSGPQYENDPLDATPSSVIPDADGNIRWSTTATDYVWNGSVNTNWHNASNWTPAAVPTAIDNANIPTIASGVYPVLQQDVEINHVNITATPAAAATSILSTAGFDITIYGSITKTGANGTVYCQTGSTMTVAYDFTFPAAARFNAALGSTVVFASSTSINLAYTFEDVRVLGYVFFPNPGKNTSINNLRLSSGNLAFVNQSMSINVRGNWLNDGGNFSPAGGRIIFVSSTTADRTITSNGVEFSTVLFQPAAGGSCRYILQDDMVCNSNGNNNTESGTSLRLVGNAANRTVQLDVNGKSLKVNNIWVESNGVALSAFLNMPAGSILMIGSGYSLETRGAFRSRIDMIGTSSNRVTVTRQGNATYAFNLGANQPVDFSAVYTDFEYMNGNGINLTNTTIDATNNLSNCTFSNFTGVAGDLLRLPNQLMNNVTGVVFYFNGSPTAGTHFNVFRSAAGTGAVTFVDAQGNLSGMTFERDPAGPVDPGNIIWNNPTATTIYWGPFATGGWNDSPSKWRDNLGNVVPVPTNTINVILDHTHQPTAYTISIDATNAVCKSLLFSSNGTGITLDQGANSLTIAGNFQFTSVTDTLRSAGNTLCAGNWLMNSGTFVNTGTTTTLEMNGPSATIASGNNSLHRLRVNAPGSVVRLSDNLRLTGSLFLTNGTLDVGTGNYSITLNGGSWTGSASGFFNCRQGFVYFTSSTATQSITNPNAQQFFNLVLNKTVGNVSLVNDIFIQSSLIFTASNKARINTGANAVRMQEAASSIGVNPVGSNGFVNGRMSFIYNSAAAQILRTYTIGKAGATVEYLPIDLTIRLGSSNNTEFMAEAFQGAPPARTLPIVPEIVQASSTQHYYTVDKLDATAVAEARITIRYTASDMVSMGSTYFESLRILKESASGADWENLTPLGAGGFGNASGGFLTSTLNFTVFSDFVVGATPDPLPVELTAFQAQYNPSAQNVQLDWSTLMEVNNSGFRIYRSDNAAAGYALLQDYATHPALLGNGNSAVANEYATADGYQLVPSQTYYYRLEQVDFDGAARIAGTASVTIPTDFRTAVSVYPNPASEQATLSVGIAEGGTVQAELIDASGRVVAEIANRELPAGLHAISFSTANLPAGVYIYRVLMPGASPLSGRLVVQP